MRRIDALRRGMTREGAAAFLVTYGPNRRYLTGFSGDSGFALVTPDGEYLLTDGRYVEQAEGECSGVTVVDQGAAWLDALAELSSGDTLAIEADHMSVATYQSLKNHLEGVEILPTRGLVETLRRVKEPSEIEAIRKASAIADAALQAILPNIRPGISERALARALLREIEDRGGDGPSFDFIVASGPRSSLPHGEPTARHLAPGDWVTIDWGAVAGGYHSDCTRTFVLDPPGDPMRKVYAVVEEALRRAMDMVRPGVLCCEVDAAARSFIEAEGYGKAFKHGLGHGVGLEIHEGPSLGRRDTESRLESGMVVTVEPGIYLSGVGGVRIEQCAVVQEGQAELLTHLPTALQVI